MGGAFYFEHVYHCIFLTAVFREMPEVVRMDAGRHWFSVTLRRMVYNYVSPGEFEGEMDAPGDAPGQGVPVMTKVRLMAWERK